MWGWDQGDGVISRSGQMGKSAGIDKQATYKSYQVSVKL